MNPFHGRQSSTDRLPLVAAGLGLVFFLMLACSSTPRKPGLPPSASDLPLLGSGKICDLRPQLQGAQSKFASSGEPWGSGKEIRVRSRRGEWRAAESYFFDQDDMLVGFLITFTEGLPLKPYPVLRDTLSQLTPSVEFYQSLAGVPTGKTMETTALYLTGDETSTTQYMVVGKGKTARLLSASMSKDPYYKLMSPYRREFLHRLATREKAERLQGAGGPGSEDKEPFRSLQQFARGETALLRYCGTRDDDIAADAYQQAIASGFTSKKLLAEAHHKLGLALKGQGKLSQAREHIERSLEILPNRPEVLNNLGEVYEELGERQRALALFEKAVALKPNYALARFNLAEAYERVNRRRAIEEYETYLAIVEDIPEEAGRASRAEQRLEQLTR